MGITWDYLGLTDIKLTVPYREPRFLAVFLPNGLVCLVLHIKLLVQPSVHGKVALPEPALASLVAQDSGHPHCHDGGRYCDPAKSQFQRETCMMLILDDTGTSGCIYTSIHLTSICAYFVCVHVGYRKSSIDIATRISILHYQFVS